MCGIFALLNSINTRFLNNTIIEEQFYKGKQRGPEYSKLEYNYLQMCLGFHRLAINGLNIKSGQPIVYEDIILICNGEIYNYKKLYADMNVTPTTDSDCEVIIHLFLKYGIKQTLIMLDGEYAFILFDNRINNKIVNNIYIARDPFGVRPLYQLYNINKNTHNLCNLYGFASELKCLEYFYNQNTNMYRVQQFEPGTYSAFQYGNKVHPIWKPLIKNNLFFIPSFSYTKLSLNIEEYLFLNVSTHLNEAVIKRCNATERPIACLLSGGLDSSLIAALACNYFLKLKKEIQIETFSIGLQDSEDIKYAKIVSNYIGSKHTEIIVTEQEMFDAIPQVIKAIESYDTTTIRASIGNYLIGKYISKNSQAKVILNGDGSDELFGGYLYMNKCPDDIEFDKETRRLLKDIYLFDVLRSDKSISSNGLEPRTPFLDITFVNYILSIPSYFRNHTNLNQCEKYLLRQSFTKMYFVNYNGTQILPNEILWRQKEAFSDGVSSKGRSLFTILQELIANQYNNKDLKELVTEPSIELEKKYYKEIFDKEFPNCSHVLPYFWMPKYIKATDPSARTLEVYNKTIY